MTQNIQTRTLSAAGNSTWVGVNNRAYVLGIGIGCSVSSAASLTYSVQHTFDDLALVVPCSITRTTTTATVTLANHGLSVGDDIIVSNAGAPLDGEFSVAAVTDANTFTYAVANSGVTKAKYTAGIVTLRVFPHSTLVLQTARADGNYEFPPSAFRLNVSVYSSGSVTMKSIQQDN